MCIIFREMVIEIGQTESENALWHLFRSADLAMSRDESSPDASFPAYRQLRALEDATVAWMLDHLGTPEDEARDTVRRLFSDSSSSSSSSSASSTTTTSIKYLRERADEAVALRAELDAQRMAWRRHRWNEEHEDELRSAKYEEAIHDIFTRVFPLAGIRDIMPATLEGRIDKLVLLGVVSTQDLCRMSGWHSQSPLWHHFPGVVAERLKREEARRHQRCWELRVLGGHVSRVNSVAILPSLGSGGADCAPRVVSSSKDQTIKIWNAWTGITEKTIRCPQSSLGNIKVLPMQEDGVVRAVTCARPFINYPWSLSKREDESEFLEPKTKPNPLDVWNLGTGLCELSIIDPSCITCMDIVPNGDDGAVRIVVGSYSKGLQIFNLSTGECERTIDHTTELLSNPHVTAVCVLPRTPGDGDSLRAVSAYISYDHSWKCAIYIWNLTTGECEKTIDGFKQRVDCFTVLPVREDGAVRVASSDSTRCVRIWNLTSGECERAFLGHTNTVNCICVIPTGHDGVDRIASGCHDGYVRVWNLSTGKCEHEVLAHDSAVNSVCAVPGLDDLRVAQIISAGSDHAIKVWECELE